MRYLSPGPFRGSNLRAAGLCIALGSAVGCAVAGFTPVAAENTTEQSTETEWTSLREGLSPLDFKEVSPDSKVIAAYFDFYGLSFPQHEHHFGTFRSGEHLLVAHAFRPRAARGTVILMHGFLDHVGTLSSTIQHLLGQGFAVAAYDEPGHGLSSGPRASIDDFANYTGVFEDFLMLCRAHMPPPCHTVAHSTGASVVLDYLLSHEDDDLEHVVLLAPLVRSAYWRLSTTVTPIVDVFVDDVPRVFRSNTSDEQFLEFVRQDPLQPRRTSIAWFNALVEWNERIKRLPPNPRPIAIIQGNADSVVDWEYNLKFLVEKFPDARVDIIDVGRHQLLNEGPALRAEVLRIVDDVLAGRWRP